MIEIVIASYLEPQLVERIRSSGPNVRVSYRPDLIPQPRYVADHTGAPFKRSEAQDAEWREILSTAEVAFDFDYVRPANYLEYAPRLDWVQSTSSGIGSFVERTGLRDTKLTLTTAAGIHGQPLAEFVLWATLAVSKRYLLARAQQRDAHWQRFYSSELAGSQMLVVGVGGIGRRVAEVMRANGVTVIGSKRTPARPTDLGVDKCVAFADIDMVLPQMDHVVLACPLTPETERMINRDRLARFKPGASLINIGRGQLVDHDALLTALDQGTLGAAVLDVTDPEPLPTDHPLWNHEKTIIFPHSASTSVKENERLVDLFLDNLGRYVEGKELRNVYCRDRGY